jgi:hypothetical protein
MRFVAPARSAVNPAEFNRPPLSQWREFDALLDGPDWPDIATLNACAQSSNQTNGASLLRFVAQTPALARESLHYEQRIAERGEIATREGNWHDLLNALLWIRHPQVKAALNLRQVAEIAIAGPKQRTRAQCALTHFDEAGVIVALRDPPLLALWDAHDWHGLFWRERAAWSDGRIDAIVFGHALLEHALRPAQLLVGKALVIDIPQGEKRENTASSIVAEQAIARVATAIRAGNLLNDPQELRPLPLSGIPKWHVPEQGEDFYTTAECFRPLRPGRKYPRPLAL